MSDISNIPAVPQAISNLEVGDGGSDVSAKDLLMVFGAIALGLFITGNIMFNVANYQAVKQLKSKAESKTA